MRRSLRLLSAGTCAGVAAASGALLLVHGGTASADVADPAHVVVYRVGSGTALTNAAAPVFLDRYTTTGTLEGTVTVPTAAAGANHALTASGLSRSEGRLSLSPDGTLLSFAGYDAAVGTSAPDASYQDVNGATVNYTPSLTASDPTSVGRVVGLLDGANAVDTSTSLTGAAIPHIARAATTVDGASLYLGGDSGVVNATRGATTGSAVLASAGLDTTALAVGGGQLLATGGYDKEPTKRIVTVGAGTPTSGADVTGLNGLPNNLLPGGFVALDLTSNGFGSTGLDTLYVANATEKAGAVDKFVFDGTTWGKAGTVQLPGVLAVTAKATGTVVQFAATTATALYSFNEADGTAAGFVTSDATSVATAPAGTEFRGVALAPTGDALSKPTVAIGSPASGAHVASNATSLHVTGTASALRGIGSVTVKVDSGTPVAATVTGDSWAADVPVTGLATGAHSLTATATDTGDTPAQATTEIGIVRDAAPTVAISTPTAGQHISYLTSTFVVKATASAYRGISGVTVKVDSGGAYPATLSGGVWSRSITVSSLAVGTHTVTVSGKETTSGATTTVARTFVRDGVPAGTVGPGAYSFTNKLISKSTGWTTVAYSLSPDRKALRTTGTSYVKLTSYGRGLDLHFQRRTDAGKVRVTIDGKAYVFDLWSTSNGDLLKSFRGLTAGKHAVTIQALHQRNTRSKGYIVLLGSLRVYA